jgi:D-3-phosphoglycerate dehydrogenase
MTTNKKKLLITESFSQQGRALLRERGDIEAIEFPNMISAADFEKLLQQQAPVHGVALGATRFGEPELEAAKEMQVVARIGVGYDSVDVAALSRRKVPLMVAGTANSPSVAEQALFMMLTLAKRGVELHALVKGGKWSTRLGLLPFDLFGKTVLIIGFGRIGTRTAKRCLAMEMNVLVYDPYQPAAEIKAAGCEPVQDLDAALPRADFVTLHCPKTPETTAMFDAARLARMKPSSSKPPCTTRWCPASSAAPASMSSSRSRRPATPCSTCPMSSSRPMSPASPARRSTAWASRPPATC